MYVRKERLVLRRYLKLGGCGARSRRKIFKFKGSEMVFPAFSAGDNFQKTNNDEKSNYLVVYLTSLVLSVRYCVYGKKGQNS